MATKEAVGSNSGEYLHGAEVKNWRHAMNGAGVIGHTLTLTVTEANRVISVPAFTCYVPDGAGGLVYVSYAGGNVNVTASDGTNPRMDLLTIDASGTVGMADGVATAETGNVAEAPCTTLDDDEILIAVVRSPAAQANVLAANIRGRAIDVSELTLPRPVNKYMSATQVFTANTTYADLVTSGAGTMSFPVAANGVYQLECTLWVTCSTTGGLKLQLTGPAAPTDVKGQAYYLNYPLTGDNPELGTSGSPAGAFSTALMAVNSGSTTGLMWGVEHAVRVYATIINGANAGTVTVQGAQNSAAGTTTFSIGSRMTVTRII